MANIPIEGGVPLEPSSEFDLLKFLDDGTLISHLGIEPVLLEEDGRTKLVDANASDFLPATPDVTQNQNYYTIDDDTAEPQLTTLNNVVFSDTPLVTNNGEAVTLSPVVLTTAQEQQTFSLTGEVQLADGTSLLLLNTAPVEDPTCTVEVQQTVPLFSPPAAIPSPSILTPPPTPTPTTTTVATTTKSTTPKGKSLKRCNRKQPREVKSTETPEKAKPPRRRRPKKEKKYELAQELEDPVLEKKRLNAINAKKNRDKKKNQLDGLSSQVETVTKERDALLKEVEELKRRETILRSQLLTKFGVQLPDF